MVWPSKPDASNMYTDMMSEFVDERHEVTVLTINEARNNMPTAMSIENTMRILRVRCGNIQKTNKYKKVISSMFANFHIIAAAKKYLRHEKFELLIFALPPTTIAPSIRVLKKMYGAKLYLLLKEFWPQDPADLGAMNENGMVWKFFEKLSSMLYVDADYIGTMSEAGIAFLNKKEKCNITATIETCPNCLKESHFEKNDDSRKLVFKKYNIPLEKIVCVFGGNLGVSQGIPQMINSIKCMSKYMEYHFLIIGSGTEASVVKKELSEQANVQIMDWIPTRDYEEIVKNSDIGMIFLYPEYTVPNIPSRFIGYLKYGLPIMACIDRATDLGEIIMRNTCGYYVYNGDIDNFLKKMLLLKDEKTRSLMSENSRKLFETQYTSRKCYEIIIKHF
jgi:glycosyltransferase involved in cell wall biosynthesis